MKTNLLPLSACALVFAACANHQLAMHGDAKISKQQAESIALTKAPKGHVISSELEHEKGYLVWSFDIAMPGTKTITEVLVDSKSGKIVDTSTESPAQQAKEAAEDKRKQ